MKLMLSFYLCKDDMKVDLGDRVGEDAVFRGRPGLRSDFRHDRSFITVIPPSVRLSRWAAPIPSGARGQYTRPV